MGKRLQNWLSKASTQHTRILWKSRWRKFVAWATTAQNPLTGQPYMDCSMDDVDDVIRRDFETMASHLFQDKYRDLLTKYAAKLAPLKSNTALSFISSVRSFFSNEAMSIKLQKGKLPSAEMAMNEHRFTLDDFRRMWLVADLEGKARLSVAVSLGWSIKEFLNLTKRFIQGVLANNVDDDGFAAFDYRRGKTGARIKGILTPDAIHDVKQYLKTVSNDQATLWSVTTNEGMNYWLRTLAREANITPTGTIRFHLIRKYVFDVAYSKCGKEEAKLLVGKKIPLSDATYLHNLEDRLVDKYKQFSYPMLKLNIQTSINKTQLHDLEEKVKALETTVTVLSQTTRLQDEENKKQQRKLEALKQEYHKKYEGLKIILGDLEELVRYHARRADKKTQKS